MNGNDTIERVADQYRDEGYEVVVRPGRDRLPAFAADLPADLIAERGAEKVWVVARPRRSDLADEPAVNRAAEVVNAQTGWRFDLVILEPDAPLGRLAGTAAEPSPEQFRTLLRRARAAEAAGLHEMALVSAWAALEAALRRAGGRGENWKPNELLAALYSNGVVTRAEFDRAREAWAVRNRVVHGFVAPPFDPALTDDLLTLAGRVMGEEVHPPAAVG